MRYIILFLHGICFRSLLIEKQAYEIKGSNGGDETYGSYDGRRFLVPLSHDGVVFSLAHHKFTQHQSDGLPFCRNVIALEFVCQPALFCRRGLPCEIFIDELLYFLVCQCFILLVSSVNTFFLAAEIITATEVFGMPVCSEISSVESSSVCRISKSCRSRGFKSDTTSFIIRCVSSASRSSCGESDVSF